MTKLRVPLTGLGCAASTRRSMEAELTSLPGVLSVYLNPVNEVLFLQVEPSSFDPLSARALIEAFGARLPDPETLRGDAEPRRP